MIKQVSVPENYLKLEKLCGERISRNLAEIAGYLGSVMGDLDRRGDEDAIPRELLAQAVAVGAIYHHFRNVSVEEPMERALLDSLAAQCAVSRISLPSIRMSTVIKP